MDSGAGERGVGAAPPTPASAPAAAPADALVGVSRSRTFLPELEALRGIAVVLVFLFHVDAYLMWGKFMTGSLLTGFMRAGHGGVDLFFLLSGFLLGLPFIADGLGGRRVSTRTFFARRALRILPLYYVAVVGGVLLTAHGVADLARAVPYLFFLNGVAPVATPIPPYSDVWWSLATETQFYLLLPLLPLALRTRRGRIVGGLLLAAYAIAYVAMLRGRLAMPTVRGQMTFLFSIFGKAPLFALGLIAAWIYQVYGERLRVGLARHAWLRNGGADLLLAANLLALAFFLRQLSQMPHTWRLVSTNQWWHSAHCTLWIGVLLLLLVAPLRSKPLICNAALSRLGVLSYSVYMVHVPFMAWGIGLARSHIPGLYGWSPLSALVVAVLSVGCYAVCTQTYRWIERPFLVRKSRFE